MNRTLAQKLFFRMVPVLLVTIVGIAVLAFHSATKKINNVYDAQLIDSAGVLWMMEADEFSEGDKAPAPLKLDSQNPLMRKLWQLNEDADDYSYARMMRIWHNNQIVIYSDTALPVSIPPQQEGFSNLSYKGEEWRIFDLPVPEFGVKIEVGEKISLRQMLVRDILMDLFMPLLFLVPLLGALVWFGISNGISSIQGLVQQIKNRSPADLSDLDVHSLPKDIEPLKDSINQLFAQLERSLTAERRFADHAAHQLRTPLTALTLQLQMLADTHGEEERHEIISNLLVSSQRAVKLVGQLLTMARIGHENPKMRPVALYETTASVMAELGPLADKSHIELALTGDENSTVQADETMLRIMLGNIIENALKYTGHDGHVAVDISPQENMWRISVTDTGPGIPEEHREAAFHRFVRIGEPKEEGTGLGLAIVAEVVQRFSGNISFKTPDSGTGLAVEVLVPKA